MASSWQEPRCLPPFGGEPAESSLRHGLGQDTLLSLALLQSPPSRQGADRTLSLWSGRGPGPLNTSLRLLAFLLGT